MIDDDDDAFTGTYTENKTTFFTENQATTSQVPNRTPRTKLQN
jgi:hypothetical protein